MTYALCDCAIGFLMKLTRTRQVQCCFIYWNTEQSIYTQCDGAMMKIIKMGYYKRIRKLRVEVTVKCWFCITNLLSGTRGLYDKKFYGCNLQIFVISQCACPGKPLQPSLMFVGKARAYPRASLGQTNLELARQTHQGPML